VSGRPDENGKEPSHRLRLGAGLLLGTLLSVWIGHRLLEDSLAENARFGEERRAVAALRSLTDLVARDGEGDAIRAAWPARFRARFPDATPVAPRVLVGATRSGELRACRERLGRAISAVKERSKTPPPEGVLERV